MFLASRLSRAGVRTASATRNLAYTAPLRDMTFILKEVLDCETHYKKIGYDEADWDTVEAIMQECAKFSENVLDPINVSGDREKAVLHRGEGKKLDARGKKIDGNRVTTPAGFKEAYAEWCEGGWSSLTVPEAYGGQGLPVSVGVLKAEMVGTANWAWGMYPGLSMGCMNTLILHGSEAQKETYLPKLASGVWTGTMCLTEPQCGTDLGQVKTVATPQEDGTFHLNGTKIFISAGDHDLSENIVHIVLARLPDAPPGTKGISLFLVPKHLIAEDGSLEEGINVECSRLEDKMGINASATAELQFADSVGYMIGEVNGGLEAMFTFMLTARLGTGLQGIGAADAGYQASAPYAKERLSMRALGGKKYPEKAADPLIVHADIRRQLLTQRVIAEGGRALLYGTALLGDYWLADKVDAKTRKEMEDYMGVWTPIVKGVITELGVEAASHAMQVWGGHGYIRDNFPEQNYRDARIGTMYEGTTGVQALDLIGRQVLLNKMKNLNKMHKEIRGHCMKHITSSTPVGSYARTIAKYVIKWNFNTMRIGMMAAKDKDVVGAVSVDYLYYAGYITIGYYWMRMAAVAEEKLKQPDLGADEAFYRSKLALAEFYFAHILPRADSHATSMLNGTRGIMDLKDDEF